MFRASRSGDFAGVGFGFSRDRPSGSLAKFGVRRGHAIIRVGRGNESYHLHFANDFRAGPFWGEATDLGATGTLVLGYAHANRSRQRRVVLGFDMFTPVPDYLRAPSNPQNSDDGAKRSWFTTEPWADVFHGNLYVGLSEQQDDRLITMRAGVDSARLGAYIQNTIHDGFGLYPRYPWPTEQTAKPYVELALVTGSL